MKFHTNIVSFDKINRFADSEESISKTIEELLEINNLIPSRRNEHYTELQEGQLDNDKNYEASSSRGEHDVTTESQMDNKKGKWNDSSRNNDEKNGEEILELSLDKADSEDEGRRPEAWDNTGEPVRGHRDVAPIWKEVYEYEDERKKLDKGQLEKKLKASSKKKIK